MFVEDLSDENLAARLSFSTKITDYLKAGKCILAIGNKDLAPIEYLKEQNAAFVCEVENEIYPVLQSIIRQPSSILEKARNAFECGKSYHDGNMITNKLYNILSNC